MDEDQTLRSMVRDDAYRVVRVLADGPSGRTELVTFDGEGQLVRKHIPSALANASAWAAAMELDEPLLPHIEELYRMPSELVVVYDYVPGDALNVLVQRKGHLGANRAVSVLLDVCKAVSALHGRGVVHRDITPGNVIVAADGAHLVDLGIARQRQEGQKHDTTTLGTWGFAAPEQFGFAQTDARSDVYSLGCLLGYALTGVSPDDEGYDAALRNHSLVDERLAAVVEKASAFEPSARYQSAAELADAARDALSSIVASGARTTRFSLEDEAAWDLQEDSDGAPAQYVPPVSVEAPGLDGQARRSFGEAPLAARVALIVWWTILSAFGLIVAATTVSLALDRDPVWGPAQYAMSFFVQGGLIVIGYEALKAVRLEGLYATEVRPLRRLIKRTCIEIVFIFALMMASAIILPNGSKA